jgi:hypothetical protein
MSTATKLLSASFTGGSPLIWGRSYFTGTPASPLYISLPSNLGGSITQEISGNFLYGVGRANHANKVGTSYDTVMFKLNGTDGSVTADKYIGQTSRNTVPYYVTVGTTYVYVYSAYYNTGQTYPSGLGISSFNRVSLSATSNRGIWSTSYTISAKTTDEVTQAGTDIYIAHTYSDNTRNRSALWRREYTGLGQANVVKYSSSLVAARSLGVGTTGTGTGTKWALVGDDATGNGGVLHFGNGQYPTNTTWLRYDPAVTYLSGVAFDSNGDIVAVGSGSVIKMDQSGSTLWKKTLTSSGASLSANVKVLIDSTDNIYIFSNKHFIKLDSSGALLWARYVPSIAWNAVRPSLLSDDEFFVGFSDNILYSGNTMSIAKVDFSKEGLLYRDYNSNPIYLEDVTSDITIADNGTAMFSSTANYSNISTSSVVSPFGIGDITDMNSETF